PSLEAADILTGQEIEVEVIDLRSLNPLDIETIVQSAKKTGRVAVVTEAHKRLGMSAEISAIVNEHVFSELKAPVLRIAAKDVPVPATTLEKYTVPNVDNIIDGIRRLVNGR
ncbi:MAG: transketolase C-terminal domain-containing protein, partial [Spirochaetota bacterium]